MSGILNHGGGGNSTGTRMSGNARVSQRVRKRGLVGMAMAASAVTVPVIRVEHTTLDTDSDSHSDVYDFVDIKWVRTRKRKRSGDIDDGNNSDEAIKHIDTHTPSPPPIHTHTRQGKTTNKVPRIVTTRNEAFGIADVKRTPPTTTVRACSINPTPPHSESNTSSFCIYS